jgi:DNA polymerase-4
MARYKEKSDEVMAIFSDFSPDVKPISIDEAFIDITGTERLLGPAETVAKNLKNAVREKTGLIVSLGLASNEPPCGKPRGIKSDFRISIPPRLPRGCLNRTGLPLSLPGEKRSL